VDSPVLGSRQPAEHSTLTVFASGPDTAKPAVQPVFDAIGIKTVWLGPEPGLASRLKLIVNSWVLAVTAGAAEAIALANGLGVDPKLFLDAVSGGPLDCQYLRVKAETILKGDFSAISPRNWPPRTVASSWRQPPRPGSTWTSP
jgi:3-hydroxyisobutyrate dehydrogenase